MRVVLFLFAGVCCARLAQSQEITEFKVDWKKVIEDRLFESKGQSVTDANFWELDAAYFYFTDYPLIIFFPDGTSIEIHAQYEGLPKLIDKKQPLLDSNFQRIEKAELAYLLFDQFLFRNMQVGEMVSEDFAITCIEGPISVYREYLSSPITKDNTASGFRIFKDGKEYTGFYLGKFDSKASRLVKDYTALAEKVERGEEGYTQSDENLFRIVNEYNNWVKENDPVRFEAWSGIKSGD